MVLVASRESRYFRAGEEEGSHDHHPPMSTNAILRSSTASCTQTQAQRQPASIFLCTCMRNSAARLARDGVRVLRAIPAHSAAGGAVRSIARAIREWLFTTERNQSEFGPRLTTLFLLPLFLLLEWRR